MTDKHTPGPWRIGSKCDERGKTWIGGSNENGCAVLPYLAIINWPDHQDANARLIAAAPDMLQALKIIECESQSYMSSNALGISEVRAAIAKAEGGDMSKTE